MSDRMKVLRVHTERRTPSPTKTTFAGGNTCQINMRLGGRSRTSSCSEAYRTDTFSECLREGMKDVHSWVEPLHVVTLRLIEVLDLLLKHGKDVSSRIAGFEPGSKRVREKFFPCTFFVRFQGIIENWPEVGRCGSGSMVSARHKGKARNGHGGEWGKRRLKDASGLTNARNKRMGRRMNKP